MQLLMLPQARHRNKLVTLIRGKLPMGNHMLGHIELHK